MQSALLSGYSTPDALAEMVRKGLGEHLAVVAVGDNLGSITLKLIDWAESTGRLGKLIAEASRQNSGNADLRQLVVDSAEWPGGRRRGKPISHS